jgi:hypothetical protein
MADRHGRRRPFSNWMKRLANLKSSSVSNHADTSSKRGSSATSSKSKKSANAKNNPYPLSGTVNTNSRNDRISWAESIDRYGGDSRLQSQPPLRTRTMTARSPQPARSRLLPHSLRTLTPRYQIPLTLRQVHWQQ